MKTLEQRAIEKKNVEKMIELKKAQKEHVIDTVLSMREGRDFVRGVLEMLDYNRKNTPCSAEAYRIAARQAVAVDLYSDIYRIAPDMWELMMREGIVDRDVGR